MELSQGAYRIQGIDLHALVKEFGTPLYVYDAEKILFQLRTLKTAFAASDVKIKYAAKALTNLSILKLLKKAGSDVDVVSIQEARLAIRAGFTPSQIMYTPSGVDFSEIMEAVHLKLTVNLDNLSSLRKFGEKYHDTYPCSIRLNPHIMAGGNIKISTGHGNSKFGISIHQLDEIKAVVAEHQIKINGLHIHTGSDITDSEVFLRMAEILFEAARDFKQLRFIDFGSGFKVAYKEGDVVTNVYDLGLKLTKVFNDFCQSYGRKLELHFEPGKFIVSEAGFLLAKTNILKTTSSVTFVGVDTGLNHLLRPMMYDAHHDILNLSNPTGERKKYTVVGYICETDTIGADREINEVREGDILAIKNAGAYGYSMASNYNSRPRPAEVLIINGQAKLIREREKLEDLLRGQPDVDI
jgi:diaminopimelate decarboxylase